MNVLTPRDESQRDGRAGRLRPSAALIIWISILAAIAFAPARWPGGGDVDRSLRPEIGYRLAADRLAEAGILRVRSVPRPAGAAPYRRVDIDRRSVDRGQAVLADCRTPLERTRLPLVRMSAPPSSCLDRLGAFAEASYLGQDMRQLGQWNVEGNDVESIRGEAHVLRSPGVRPGLWRGKITYRPASPGGAGQTWPPSLVLAQVGTGRGVFRFTDGQAIAENVDSILRAREFAAEGLALEMRVDSAGRESITGGNLLTFQRLGRTALIGLPPVMGGVAVFVDGVQQVDRSKFGNTRYVLVRPEQFVTIEKGSRRLTLQLVETPGAISEFSGRRRLREASLSDVAQRFEQAGLAGNFSATIDAVAQRDLQRRLARRMLTGVARGRPPALSYRGATLIMDGMSGEILAAATFPTDPDQLGVVDRQDPNRLRWLRTNFNFEPLAIGSSAKVPFAAAITQTYPKLLAMRLPYRPAFRAIDGRPLDLPFRHQKALNNSGNGKSGPVVDFDRFLAYSNNEYALTLLQRATLQDRRLLTLNSESGWPSGLWRFGCVIPYALRDLQDGGWPRVFDVCSPYLWRDSAGNPLGDHQARIGRLELRMAVTQNDYTDYYLDILGGGRSNWTTANLGQSYARILAGRAVDPQLHYVDNPAPAPRLTIAPAVWTAISRGMADVVRIGTAKALVKIGLGRPPPGIFYFAKTGTPTIEIPSVQDGHVIVLAAARTSTGRPPAGPADICGLRLIVINLQRDASNAVDFAAELLGPEGNGRYLGLLTPPPCSAPTQRKAGA